ncbi:aldehyde ferredoxin oxidoreductase N-terminal domain-containing protein [Desulfatiglans anilini]|uniref:aldehyde ferredoxin oxidoreductase N-terminal domain-containing protein n=1 Tax=Desulfatiglans anilini TaxID=90728 RepID=UPI0004254D44|nr:aldehyde ferredoxin oxidoreductase C-terminal domain-containing protein [Desulfatiglans anilini]
MIRDYFRVLLVDLETGKGRIERVEGRDTHAGGSGLAALLFERFGIVDRLWDDPEQPFILAIGPLTGFFPLMSKTICAFKSPYHNQFAESHAGGRSALALRFADLDALVVVGRANVLSCLVLGSKRLEVRDVAFMRGMDVSSTGKIFRRMFPGAGHRSILRIGPAGERLAATACINVDSYRHFGRLGAGAVLGAKNLKGIFIHGDGIGNLPDQKGYSKLYQRVYRQLTSTDMMKKYHNLGTPENIGVLNELKALPIRNLQKTSDVEVKGITGERFAEETLMRNQACSGCPIGCIHLGYVREQFMKDNRYFFIQVPYDHEPIFAVGAMLGVNSAFKVLGLIDAVERAGLDVMSTGVALAWATEAFAEGILSEEETLIGLRFGDAEAYKQAVYHMGRGTNPFYRLLSDGIMHAVRIYGGGDYACVLGQEMAGYATGEVFLTGQALGFRHSHLDTGGYTYDQQNQEKNAADAVDFLVEDEQNRVLLTSMAACLFARKVYQPELLAECLESLGYAKLARNIGSVAASVQRLRWNIRLATGYEPHRIDIPKRFLETVNWKGAIDASYLDNLKSEYSRRILQFKG